MKKISILRQVAVWLLLITISFTFTFAQKNIWKDKSNANLSLKTAKELPTQYRSLELEISSLQEILLEAPLRFSEKAKTKKVDVPIPLPNGEMTTFQVVEAPIMAAELAVKFRDIRTYEGIAKDGSNNHLRLTMTSKGVTAVVFSDTTDFYVEPMVEGDVTRYISYDVKDAPVNPLEHACQVEKSIGKTEPNTQDKSMTDDCVLRSYRIAVAAIGEYTQALGGTVEDALEGIVTTLNTVTNIFERDLGITFELVANNDEIIYTDPDTDPYTNPFVATNLSLMLGENQTNLDGVIGFNNYDIGHVLTDWPGGITTFASACTSQKAHGLTGSPSLGVYKITMIMAHELGHQFGADHTFNNSCGGNRWDPTAVEPGSGSTIMSYAGIVRLMCKVRLRPILMVSAFVK